MYMPMPDESEGLPPIGATIYVERDVPDHQDPQGWYLATVIDHQADSQAHILFPNSQSEQLLCLMSTRWHLTRKAKVADALSSNDNSSTKLPPEEVEKGD